MTPLLSLGFAGRNESDILSSSSIFLTLNLSLKVWGVSARAVSCLLIILLSTFPKTMPLPPPPGRVYPVADPDPVHHPRNKDQSREYRVQGRIVSRVIDVEKIVLSDDV